LTLSKNRIQNITIIPETRLCEYLRRLFVDLRKNPPGYREAKIFVDEMRWLRACTTIYPSQALALKEKWHTHFKGLLWLFYELTTCLHSPFTDPRKRENPPEPSTSLEEFVIFLVNMQYPRSLFIQLLPWPEEHPKIESERDMGLPRWLDEAIERWAREQGIIPGELG